MTIWYLIYSLPVSGIYVLSPSRYTVLYVKGKRWVKDGESLSHHGSMLSSLDPLQLESVESHTFLSFTFAGRSEGWTIEFDGLGPVGLDGWNWLVCSPFWKPTQTGGCQTVKAHRWVNTCCFCFFFDMFIPLVHFCTPFAPVVRTYGILGPFVCFGPLNFDVYGVFAFCRCIKAFADPDESKHVKTLYRFCSFRGVTQSNC